MKLLSKILRFYINASIHVALAVVSFTCITYMDFDVDAEANLLIFVFFSTIVAYTFVKYIPLVRNTPLRLTNSLKAILSLALISIIPIVVSFTRINFASMVVVGVLGIFTLLYVLPFLPKAKNLRDVSGLKIFIIALVWCGTTVILPLVASNYNFGISDLELVFYSISRFLMVIALIIPFEIRDLKLDDIYLKTVPQVLGVVNTKMFTIGLVFLSLFLSFFSQIDGYTYIFMHGLMILLILGSRRSNPFLYTAFLVESIPIWWVMIKYFTS